MSSNLILVVLWTPFFFLYETCQFDPFSPKKKVHSLPKAQLVNTRGDNTNKMKGISLPGFDPGNFWLWAKWDTASPQRWWWLINLLKFKDMYVVYIYEKLYPEGGGGRSVGKARDKVPITHTPSKSWKKKTTEVWFEHTRPEAEGF